MTENAWRQFFGMYQKEEMIYGVYYDYEKLLQRLSNEIKNVMFQDNNARVHLLILAIIITMVKMNDLKSELLPHRYSSPDLASLVYFAVET